MPHEDPALPFPLLSGNDALVLLEIASKCLSCNTDEGYRDIFKQLSTILPFEMATSGLAKLDKDSTITAYDLVNISYPIAWMRTYQELEFNKIDVVVQENFTKFTPQYWKSTYKRNPPPKRFLQLASDFGIRNGYTTGSEPFGVCKKASLFSFAGNFTKLEPHIVAILRIVTPHLHQAIYNAIHATNAVRTKDLLSKREMEVINWLKHGKSSWDISAILSISERTVNFHIYNIMKKLEVVNRAQAVAVATHLGMIEID